ncbi:hypothetical protein PAPHI01_0631 [Pancytospora philotis]|nr:hypothetical protein PAPHI01_0631 [Pancytospora philotis]
MSALFNFDSFVRSFVLLVCTVAIIKRKFPSLIAKKEGMASFLYKVAVVGERLSPFVAGFCFLYSFQKFVRFFF